VHVLIATDADWVKNEVVAALGGPDTSFTVCREGRDVVSLVAKRTPDLAVLDLQVGSMGAMAVTMALRHDESAGLGPRVPILMLLDRIADTEPVAPRTASEPIATHDESEVEPGGGEEAGTGDPVTSG
jgi:DNA-binding response OmpR family regulator